MSKFYSTVFLLSGGSGFFYSFFVLRLTEGLLLLLSLMETLPKASWLAGLWWFTTNCCCAIAAA